MQKDRRTYPRLVSIVSSLTNFDWISFLCDANKCLYLDYPITAITAGQCEGKKVVRMFRGSPAFGPSIMLDIGEEDSKRLSPFRPKVRTLNPEVCDTLCYSVKLDMFGVTKSAV